VNASVSIVSEGMRGYQVFLDGSYIGTEGTGGDQMDGRFRVSGDSCHDIRVYNSQFNYLRNILQKIIYVEPGSATYI
jgi:hypothetical protein